MSNLRLNLAVASNDPCRVESVLPNVGKIVCEVTTKLETAAGECV